MRNLKNITVCVPAEIYRRARHLAAEYDTTVSAMVAWLLERLPTALERSKFPQGGPKRPHPSPSTDASTTNSEAPAPLNPQPEPSPLQRVRPSFSAFPINIEKNTMRDCETVTSRLIQEFSKACDEEAG
jgi:hypothetical protein